ncbi:hypothetical protein GJU40_09770 [Bacillus lacus]|uniref:Uncharacterized protein n=1 Tax=Metabacillus lacus TaxID=1983721 RepID=A0A7X2IZ26_9BACI|nr:hypothetical protein [Metabacillus lacus]MRX72438.1 hypothetical protein [Metabacillus lacus]
MSNGKNDHESLLQYEKKAQSGKESPTDKANKERLPDQQNRLKDQENLRK